MAASLALYSRARQLIFAQLARPSPSGLLSSVVCNGWFAWCPVEQERWSDGALTSSVRERFMSQQKVETLSRKSI